MKYVSGKIADWCRGILEMEESEYHIVEYGIELMLNTTWKLAGLFLIGLAIGHLQEVVVAMAVFGSVRYFAGGFHSDTDLGCFGAMLFICLCPIPLCGVEGMAAYIISTVLVIYSLYEIVCYAPCISKVNPIRNPEILRNKRRGSLIVSVLYAVFVLVCIDVRWRWLVTIPLFLEAFSISPLCTRLTTKEEQE